MCVIVRKLDCIRCLCVCGVEIELRERKGRHGSSLLMVLWSGSVNNGVFSMLKENGRRKAGEVNKEEKTTASEVEWR